MARWLLLPISTLALEDLAHLADLACARDGALLEVIQYLEQAFAQPSVVPPSQRVLAGLERVDAYLGAFGFRVPAGAVGWRNLFEALQGCPVAFVALEMAYAVGKWNGTDGVEYGLGGFSGSLGLRGHSAKALALARSWRIWFEKSSQIAELGWNLAQTCQGLGQWPHLNQMAQVALAALNCEQPEPTFFADLLGCGARRASCVLRSCGANAVDPVDKSWGAFWEQLQDAMRISPTLQMPYGPSQPYLLQLILEDLAQRRPKLDALELYLEFGVFQGESLNFLARGLPNVILHGFDSFRGLPAAWRDGSDIPGALSFGASSFAMPGGQLPQVEENVRLIPGWFNETIPAFAAGLEVAGRDVTIRLLHIDCDMYSSAMEVLFGLAKFLRAGSLLVFDELLNFPYFEGEELRAFYDFLRQHRWKYRIVHAPWFFLPSTHDFAEFYQKDGLSEIDLLQAVAVELL